MPRLAVLGRPVSHSRSPAMQNAALAELGLAPRWTYEAIEVAPEGLDALVRELPADGFAGVNVTVPHKLAALALADAASDAARAIGAANMLTFAQGTIAAENTDAAGLLAALPVSPAGRRALVLGAGGSARACVWALVGAGARVSIWNRTPARAEALAAELGAAVVALDPRDGRAVAGELDLLVNCTTVGLERANRPPSDPSNAAAAVADLGPLPIDPASLGEESIVVDLVYGSRPTPLVTIARDRGSRVVDGLEVLVQQGAASLRIWTGLEPPLATMRSAARGAAEPVEGDAPPGPRTGSA